MATNEIALLRDIYEAYAQTTATTIPENKVAYASRIATEVGGSDPPHENVVSAYRQALIGITGQDQDLPENEIAYLRAIVDAIEPGATDTIPDNASAHLRVWADIAPLQNSSTFEMRFDAGFA